MKWFIPAVIVFSLLSSLYLSLQPALPKANEAWQRVGQAAPAKLKKQLRKDYASHLRPDLPVDINQMQMLKLQEPGSLPLYLINTRVHPEGQPELTPTCGVGGCLFFGYVPANDGFKRVLNGLINDFQVEGAPPIVQSAHRTLNRIPCFQLTASNSQNQGTLKPQVLCFNGQDFVPAGKP